MPETMTALPEHQRTNYNTETRATEQTRCLGSGLHGLVMNPTDESFSIRFVICPVCGSTIQKIGL